MSRPTKTQRDELILMLQREIDSRDFVKRLQIDAEVPRGYPAVCGEMRRLLPHLCRIYNFLDECRIGEEIGFTDLEIVGLMADIEFHMMEVSDLEGRVAREIKQVNMSPRKWSPDAVRTEQFLKKIYIYN